MQQKDAGCETVKNANPKELSLKKSLHHLEKACVS